MSSLFHFFSSALRTHVDKHRERARQQEGLGGQRPSSTREPYFDLFFIGESCIRHHFGFKKFSS